MDIGTAANGTTPEAGVFAGWSNEQLLCWLSLLLTSDRPADPVDFGVVCGHVGSDIDGVLEEAARAYHSGMIKLILLNGTPYGENTEMVPTAHGLIAMTEWLTADERGDIRVPESAIHSFAPAYQTAEESKHTLDYAMENGNHRWASIGAPHRHLRFTSGMISAADQAGYPTAIYHISPTSVRWFEETAGSQGKNIAERWRQVNDEYLKVLANRYDNLASPLRMAKYFRERC